MLPLLFSSLLSAPPTAHVEHFDDPVLAARVLSDGRAFFVTTHRIVARSADGSRRNIAPEGCAPIASAAIAEDGAFVALACATAVASGVWQNGDVARAAALALSADDRLSFCGGWLHVDGPKRHARHRAGAWSTVEPTQPGACAGNGGFVSVAAPRVALGPVEQQSAVVTIGAGVLGTVGPRGDGETGPAYVGTPERAARVDGAWIGVDDGKLFTLPFASAEAPAAGFFVTSEKHLWVWHGKKAERMVWTPQMALREKLKPAPPILLSPPVEVRGSFARFREPLLDAVVRFSPSGDDLYGYVLVVSDRRGGAERIDAEMCEVTARHWAKRVETSAVVDAKACTRSDRRGVVKLRPSPPSGDVTFRQKSYDGMRATLAEMSGYGEGTELWLWRYDASTGDFDAASYGAPPVLELPGEP